MGSPDFAQVVVEKGNIDGSTPSPTQGKDPVDPLKTTTGTWNVCLSPFFLNPDPYISGVLIEIKYYTTSNYSDLEQ